jgi:ABC-type sugar transport system ATPase subunit
MKNNKEILLTAHGVCKRFQNVIALDSVQIEIKRCEIHALIGENGAGKSTFLKILQGIYHMDSGQIFYKGDSVSFSSPDQALRAGISMIHQEISLVQTMTVAENIWLGRESKFSKSGYLNVKRRNDAAQNLLNSFGIKLDVRKVVSTLPIALMQLVEIARAISYNSELIIMDEPTSALTAAEIRILYTIIKDLAKKGVTIIFISHKLEEIFAICDMITVLRDGKFIGTYRKEEMSENSLIQLIVGRELNKMFPKEDAKIGKPILEVKNLTKMGIFKNISFVLRTGEILGFSGLMGAGRTEIMRAIFGIDTYDSGEVLIEGKKVSIRTPGQAIRYGLGMVTEDRLRLGAIYALSVKKNMSLSYLRNILYNLFFVNEKKEILDCENMRDKLNIKVANFANRITSLSGGNQQKVVVGRCLLTNPKILILDEPTRGIDVGSKSEIHHMISKLAQSGVAIIMISSELPEILGMSDRIVVIRNGEIVYVCDREKAKQEIIMKHAFG